MPPFYGALVVAFFPRNVRSKFPDPFMKKLILTLVIASLVAIGARAQTASLTTAATNYSSAGGTVTFTATVVYPAGANTLSGVTVTAGGSGYTSAPTVVFTGGGHRPAHLSMAQRRLCAG
jgi:hypothetical protein